MSTDNVSGTDPLVFPPHYPPTMRWEKFFIGVRWLGRDLSFFRELRQQQAARTPSQMEVWGSGRRREIAESLSQAFKKEVGWHAAVFLPDDSFRVMCHGPSFGMLDELGGIAAMMRFEEQYGVRIPKSFWAGREHANFGEVVEALMKLLTRGE